MSIFITRYPADKLAPEVEYRYENGELQQVIGGEVVEHVKARPDWLLAQAHVWHREFLAVRADLSHFGEK